MQDVHRNPTGPGRRGAAALEERPARERSLANIEPAHSPVGRPAIAASCELQRSTDLEGFWRATLRLLSEALPHHSCSLMLGINDFEPRTAKHYVTEASCLGYRPATSLAVSRPFLASHPQVRLYTYSQIVSQDPHAQQRRIAQEEPLEEWVEFVHLAFWDDTRPVAVMSVRRSEHQRHFNHDELAFLESAYPTIDAAIFRLRALEEERLRNDATRMMLCGSAASSMLLDAQGDVVFATDEAYRLCTLWNDNLVGTRVGTGSSIPRDLRAMLDAGGLVDGRASIVHPRLPGMSATIESIVPDSGVFGQQIYGVLTFTQDAGARDAAVRLQRLSPSECKVALLVAEGLRNAEIADRLCRSRRTVESQLNSIYGKFGVGSRTQLVRLLHAAA